MAPSSDPDAPAADDEDPPEGEDGADIESRTAAVPPAQHGQRLDRFLVTLAPEFSRAHLQRLIDRGEVQVDDETARSASRAVRVGQAVSLRLVPTDESLAFRPEAMPLDIVYEDDHLLVIDKPAGLVVHPAAGHWAGTLLNGLLAHHAQALRLPRAGIVHRLDKDTSGLMVVGKTLPAVTALVRAIAAHEVRREYLALAHGRMPRDEASFDGPIGRDPRSRVRMAVIGAGRVARTDVWCLARSGPFSALRCRLHTGRTHQIRVHLADAGHPLVADAVYGGRAALGLARQALHALRLAFAHPMDGRPLSFERTPPPDFSAAWQQVAGSSASA